LPDPAPLPPSELSAEDYTPAERAAIRDRLFREIRARHPGFRVAIREDALCFAHFAHEQPPTTPLGVVLLALRLAWTTDAFLGLALYRVRAALMARQIPILPEILHRLSMLWCGLCIGRYTVIEPGVYVPHGQAVIDGLCEIGRHSVITPFTLVGLRGEIGGPKIGRGVFLGTGCRILGNVRIGDGAVIGANAVVTADVPAGATVVGVPARPR
jgi:serine O-acetyltransferase